MIPMQAQALPSNRAVELPRGHLLHGLRAFLWLQALVWSTLISPTAFAQSVCNVSGVSYYCTDLEKGTWSNSTGWGLGISYDPSPQPRDFLSDEHLSSKFDTYCQSLQASYVAYLTKSGQTRICSISYQINDNGIVTKEARPRGYYYYATASCPISPSIASTQSGSSCFPGQTQAGSLSAIKHDLCPTGYELKSTFGITSPTIPDCLKPIEACPIKKGNPITSTGEKRQQEIDYSGAQPALHIHRHYSSARVPVTAYSSPALRSMQRVNPLWLFDYQQSLEISPGSIVARRASGDSWAFPRSSSTVSAFNNSAIKLTPITNGWLLDLNGNLESYDAAGRLLIVSTYGGAKTSITYDSSGRLFKATDAFGRALTFSYSTLAYSEVATAVSSIKLPDGRVISYGLGDRGEILTAALPGSTTLSYGYIDAQQIWLPLLSSISVNGEEPYASFAYDNNTSVARSTAHIGGTDRYEMSDWRSNGVGSVTVTDPLGASQTYEYASVAGISRMVSATQPAGSGCAASAKALSYDTAGNRLSEDDFNGQRTCYAHDLARKIETGRVEGLATTQDCAAVTAANATLPVDSRKTSTQWHPDWMLTVKVAEPNRITTRIYNGQPDPFNGNAIASCAPTTALLPGGKPIAVLCKEVEQATTDTNGSKGFAATLQTNVANRVQSWTYNPYGQVLTAKDPQNNTTTSTYYTDTSFTGTDPNAKGHTIGDLKTVTNAANQVTQYLEYDKHGNLLKSQDAVGAQTINTYDARQRLLTSAVGGRTTSYEYSAFGQLTKLTAPEGSWIGYEYDPAHRMNAVKDDLGNRIEYTLDNAGNRTADTTKDPSGTLRKTLAKSIDALSRIQQTTGRE